MPKKSRTPADLLGRTFGCLTLKERVSEKVRRGTKIMWRCECQCGKTITRRQDVILKSKNPSCGCAHPNKMNIGSECCLWKGCGDMSGFYFSMIRRSAADRNLSFDITPEYLWDLFLQQEGRCALSGLPLRFHVGPHRTWSSDKQQTASLDRKDSLLGYVPGNVQWVHKVVNQMKNHFDDDIFKMVCRSVTRRHPGEIDREVIDNARGTRNAKTGRAPARHIPAKTVSTVARTIPR